MEDPKKRIDLMIKALQEYKGLIANLEKSVDALDVKVKALHGFTGPQTVPLRKELDATKEVLAHASGDLRQIFGKIRGYILEATTATKQLEKKRDLFTSKHGSKEADVVSKGPGRNGIKKRAFQLKSSSRPDNPSTTSLIGDALEQILGIKGEVPAADAKLIVAVEIHSGKAFYPFLAKDYARSPPHKKKFEDSASYKAIGDQATRAYKSFTAKITQISSEPKKQQQHAAMVALSKGTGIKAVTVRLIYKKPLSIDGTKTKLAGKKLPRAAGLSSNKDLASVTMVVNVVNGKVSDPRTKT